MLRGPLKIMLCAALALAVLIPELASAQYTLERVRAGQPPWGASADQHKSAARRGGVANLAHLAGREPG